MEDVTARDADPDRPDPARRPGVSGPFVLVVGDEADRAAVAPLAAAAGVTLVADAGPLRDSPSWRTAAAVVVGADALAAAPAARGATAAGPPRRAGVVVLARPGGSGPPAVPASPPGDGLTLAGAQAWEVAVRVGAEDVVTLPEGRRRLLDRLAAAAEPGCPGRVVGVVAGAGGAGASVLAAALAVAAERSWPPALLVDADPAGPGCDVLLGAGDAPGLRWADVVAAGGPVRAAVLRDAVARDPGTGTGVLAWDPATPRDLPAPVLVDALVVARRGHRVVVADLPRRLDPAVLVHLDVLLVLVPPGTRGAASTRAVLAPVRHLLADARVVVRAGSGARPGRVAEAVGLPLAAVVPASRRLDEALERGLPPGTSPRDPLARACTRLLADLLP